MPEEIQLSPEQEAALARAEKAQEGQPKGSRRTAAEIDGEGEDEPDPEPVG